ncbi:MAG TPA: type I-C CRISPR-associated endonuclease Cas1c [Accumulibacter sp.]|uniref:type I-C CRISPR-associated endonuclease Cas1c n=1 Tax=Accumulibacter sp. TaxID=2053492 RepID=UPI00287B4C3A|nr:type I-C CRISPR-associated endonuclease Cas1c [Accumulibacter sp.]MDS4015608.1 type I-C CRISPR-associated endonuclease Cas1c [Accumulibacter sp.]MDS4053767.1 type I-C CRISPR-associated endonuclease Cas1c [Accumulibacter sp.]HMV05854.1 type I-C CRISPR-associated endonuclease Cas1c [Accumulibacter sp.]HMW64459.1 type I-C CRISPR-associated endonuclease Cas1c [Accumulibacter sp.]HMW80606.1 type I-C CRISPR-associated endonuclease Cas1c [Accumulibacter sp.]
MQLLNTLYLTTPDSYVHLENQTIRVEVAHETRLRVPLHHLAAVVCFGHVAVSLPLMHRLADEGIALVLLDGNGRFKARLEGAVSGNVLLRQAQHRLASDDSFALRVARNMIAGKVRNCRQVLLRGAREAKVADDAQPLARGADNLAAALRALPQAADFDTLRGQEGEAARQYFAALTHLVRNSAREAFRMNGRSRRPPRDRINALLSFLYSLLMNDCRSAIEAAGLDPQIGFLHAVRPGRAALALDLMEEFRFSADRLALTLVNRAQLNPGDFDEREGGAVLLAGEARKTVLVAYQQRKQESVAHPLLSEPIPFGLLPHLQARLLARTLRGDTADYLPYLMR